MAIKTPDKVTCAACALAKFYLSSNGKTVIAVCTIDGSRDLDCWPKRCSYFKQQPLRFVKKVEPLPKRT